MEYWVGKADDVLALFSDKGKINKRRSHSAKPSIPAFQYSTTFDYSKAADFWALHGIPRFRC
jgi:hypothetical protein